jgi:hydrogenase maturation protease
MAKTILAAGNTMREDDGIGIFAGALLKEKGLDVLFVYDTPENFLDKLDCKQVILVDAADIETDYIITREIDSIETFSTHGMSLSLMKKYLENKGIELIIAGIKPETIGFGEKLSEIAKERAKKLVERIIREA